MSATDELRRLLDGRGVEWDGTGDGTYWEDADGNGFLAKGIRVGAGERDDRVALKLRLTPEQAVEATLGRGTCRDLAETPEYRDKTEFRCSECGYEYSAVGGFGCDYGDEPDFRYCPNCGRKVVDV